MISTIEKQNQNSFFFPCFFIFLKLFLDLKKYRIVVPPKPFPGKDWSRLMFLINSILSLRKNYFLCVCVKIHKRFKSTDTTWIWFCSVMLQRLASNSNNRVKGCSDESFLSTTSIARIPTCETFSLSELQNS